MTRLIRTAGLMALALAAPCAAWAQQAATGPNVSSVQTGAPGLAFFKTKMPLFAYSAPTERATVIDELVGQTVLQVSGCDGGWCRVVLSRAAPSYIRAELLERVTPRN